MGSQIRRIILVLVIFLLVGWIYKGWRQSRPGYDLFDALKGTPPPTEETITALPDTKPALPKGELPGLEMLNAEYSKLAAAVLPSVVSINTESVVAARPRNIIEALQGGAMVRQKGLGSGSIITKEGHVVTNYHVVAGARQIEVTTNDHTTFPAELVGVDPSVDLAVIRILSNRKDFPALSFADSNEVKVGQIVFAVGNPLGFSGTVSQGIISATQRWTQDSAMEFLQTDANIIPGNSGGPLVNLRGEIVGVNESIFTGSNPTQPQQHWQGIGLAIPADDAKESVDAMLQKRTRTDCFLGLVVDPNVVTVKSQQGNSLGVMVTNIGQGSPAQGAGLQPGDVVTLYGDRRVESANQLLRFIRRSKPGQPVEMTVVRAGKLVKLSVVPQPRPQQQPQVPQFPQR
ncbi:S1-C subfamily serine protease [Roseimicrobium gellanilyticum]|uniref:S1-C subfamily serine protease n=1 Tax=Roseimicrobium gellanilyticum TaxID=748857 RepID=A0A366H4K9_9BACT|nr:trypsin-like peptidase domain-containing protein [Roseimicrobium gellanilyticum]RBP36063.1 S1-C subfamily serine protease [Roseimicrobium gellanilyticum]